MSKKFSKIRENNMYLKFVVSGLIVLSIVGCGEKNKEYYEANIDKAEQKNIECETFMKEALKANNKDRFESLVKDKECNIAHKVMRDHKQHIAELQREINHQEYEKQRIAEEKIREEKKKKAEKEKAEKAVLFEKEYKKELNSLKTMQYAKFDKIKKTCTMWSVTSSTSPKCRAYLELKEAKKLAEINQLKEKYPKGNLEKFRDTVCKGLDFDEVYCELSQKAARELESETTAFYVNHRDMLRKDFNQCQSEYQRLQGKWKERNALTSSFECRTVSNAAAQLRVYGFSKPIR